MSLKTGISRGMGGSNQKRPSVGGVWIFSGTTHFNNDLIIIIIVIIKNNIIIIIRTFPECFAPEKFQCKIT